MATKKVDATLRVLRPKLFSFEAFMRPSSACAAETATRATRIAPKIPFFIMADSRVVGESGEAG